MSSPGRSATPPKVVDLKCCRRSCNLLTLSPPWSAAAGGNTALLYHHGKLLALSKAGKPSKLDENMLHYYPSSLFKLQAGVYRLSSNQREEEEQRLSIPSIPLSPFPFPFPPLSRSERDCPSLTHFSLSLSSLSCGGILVVLPVGLGGGGASSRLIRTPYSTVSVPLGMSP
ncbi:hypothetical protein MLD38_002789 [Melastoma candidum]|uniref:Uncharacterized protein n=1 Tax=Melastoma candidum TaxID=119954 RepID=A0ACB9S0Q8_9MYRT|nr:hypothetical protein MLD38_002789 [Melastoma candidum]